jgi:hypothetical protein
LGYQDDFIPVLAKYTGSVNLADLITDGIDQIQQQYTLLSNNDARLAIYWAFIGGGNKNDDGNDSDI